jgi:hypothetical protein
MAGLKTTLTGGAHRASEERESRGARAAPGRVRLVRPSRPNSVGFLFFFHFLFLFFVSLVTYEPLLRIDLNLFLNCCKNKRIDLGLEWRCFKQILKLSKIKWYIDHMATNRRFRVSGV